MERWRAIPDAPAYEVSDLGRVRRVLCTHCRGPLAQPRYLARRADKDGYSRVTIYRPGKGRADYRLARLVLIAFVGPPPSTRHEAAHGDGNNQNDALANLRWATPVENEEDKIRHGTRQRGERNGNAKLSRSDVRRIRYLRRQGLSLKRIAQAVGATPGNVSNIVREKSWKDQAL